MKNSLLVVLFLAIALPLLQGKATDVPGENFTIDVPDNWHLTDRPGYLLSFATDGMMSAAAIAVVPNDENRELDSNYGGQIMRNMIAQAKRAGGTLEITSAHLRRIDQVPTCEIKGKMVISNSVAYVYQYPLFANRKIYLLSLQTYDASRLPELEAIAQSIHFATPPELPSATGTAAAHTMTIPGEGITVDLPAGWTTQAMEGNILFVKDAAYDSTLSIQKTPNPKNQRVDQTYLANLKKITAQGLGMGAYSEYTGEGTTTVHGVPASYLESKVTVGNSLPARVKSYAFCANKSLYAIIVQSPNPARFTELEAMVTSLRFSSPPELPGLSDYEQGYLAGQVTFFVLLAAVGGIVVFRFILPLWKK